MLSTSIIVNDDDLTTVTPFTFTFREQEGIETPDVVWNRLNKIQTSLQKEIENKIENWYLRASVSRSTTAVPQLSIRQKTLGQDSNDSDNDADEHVVPLVPSQDSSVVSLSPGEMNQRGRQPKNDSTQEKAATVTLLLDDVEEESNNCNSLTKQQQPLPQPHPAFQSTTRNGSSTNSVLLILPEKMQRKMIQKKTSTNKKSVSGTVHDNESATMSCVKSATSTSCVPPENRWNLPSIPELTDTLSTLLPPIIQFPAKFFEILLRDAEEYTNFCFETRRQQQQQQQQQQPARPNTNNGNYHDNSSNSTKIANNFYINNALWSSKFPVPSQYSALHSATNRRETFLQFKSWLESYVPDEELKRKFGIGKKAKRRQRSGNENNKSNNNSSNSSSRKMVMSKESASLNLDDDDDCDDDVEETEAQIYESLLGLRQQNPNPKQKRQQQHDRSGDGFRGVAVDDATGHRISARILERERIYRMKQEVAERKRRRQKGYFPNFARQQNHQFVPGAGLGQASGDVTNIVVLCGATGSGTTQFVYQLANHFDVDVVECNPSSRRNASSLDKLVSEAMKAKQIRKTPVNASTSTSSNNNCNNNVISTSHQQSFFRSVGSATTTSSVSASSAALEKLELLFQENKRRRELEAKAAQDAAADEKSQKEAEEAKKKKSGTKQADILSFFAPRSKASSTPTTCSDSTATTPSTTVSSNKTVAAVVDVDAAPTITPSSDSTTKISATSTIAKSAKAAPKKPAAAATNSATKNSFFFRAPDSTTPAATSSKKTLNDATERSVVVVVDDSPNNGTVASSDSLSPMTVTSDSSSSGDLVEVISSDSAVAVANCKPAPKPRGRPKKSVAVANVVAATSAAADNADPKSGVKSKNRNNSTNNYYRIKKQELSSKSDIFSPSDDDDDDDGSLSCSSSSSSSSSSTGSTANDLSSPEQSNLEASGKGLYSIVLIEGGDIVCSDEGSFHSCLRRLAQDAQCPVIVTANPLNCPESVAAALDAPLVYLDSVSSMHQALLTGLMISKATVGNSKGRTNLHEHASQQELLLYQQHQQQQQQRSGNSPLSPTSGAAVALTSCFPSLSPFSPTSAAALSSTAANSSSSSPLSSPTSASVLVNQSQTLRCLVNVLVCFAILSSEIEVAKAKSLDEKKRADGNDSDDAFSSSRVNSSCGRRRGVPREKIVTLLASLSEWLLGRELLGSVSSSASFDGIVSSVFAGSRSNSSPIAFASSAFPSGPPALLPPTALTHQAHCRNNSSSSPSTSFASRSYLDMRKLINDLQWVTLPAFTSNNFDFALNCSPSSFSCGEDSSPLAQLTSVDIHRKVSLVYDQVIRSIQECQQRSLTAVQSNSNGIASPLLLPTSDDASSFPSCCCSLSTTSLSRHLLNLSDINALCDRFFVQESKSFEEYLIWERNNRQLRKMCNSYASTSLPSNNGNGNATSSVSNNHNNHIKTSSSSSLTTTTPSLVQPKTQMTMTSFFGAKTAAAPPPPSSSPSLPIPQINPQPSSGNNSNNNNNNNSCVTSVATATTTTTATSTNNDSQTVSNSSTVMTTKVRVENEMSKRFGLMKTAKWAKDYYATRGQGAVSEVASFFPLLKKK